MSFAMFAKFTKVFLNRKIPVVQYVMKFGDENHNMLNGQMDRQIILVTDISTTDADCDKMLCSTCCLSHTYTTMTSCMFPWHDIFTSITTDQANHSGNVLLLHVTPHYWGNPNIINPYCHYYCGLAVNNFITEETDLKDWDSYNQ